MATGQAEAALAPAMETAEGARRFREIIDALPAAIYTTDADGRVTHFNPAAVAFAGRVPELGTDRWCVTWRLYNPDGSPLPHDECPMAAALKEGRIVRGAECMMERPDGERIWFTPFPVLLRDAEGRITGGVNMLIDITDRKRAEEKLRTSEEHLRMALEAGKFGHWQRNGEGRILYVSPQCKGHFGLAPDEPVTAEAIFSAIHPEDREKVKQASERAFAESGDYEADYRCIWPDGSVHWLNSRGRVAGDSVPARLFGVTVEITQRKRAEVWLDGQRQVLEMLAKGAPLPEVLAVLIRALEKQAEELLGAVLIRDGNRFGKGIGPSLPQEYVRALDGAPIAPPYLGPCGMAVDRGETVMVRDIAGDERWPAAYRTFACGHGLRACLSVPIFASNGRTLGSFGIYSRAPMGSESIDAQLLRTATHLAGIAIESAQAQEALRRSEAAARDIAERLKGTNERLRRANFELQQFAYTASHDLQEPLRNIAVYSEMVNRRYAQALDEDGREFLGFVTAGAKRMEMLIKDLLSYTQITSAPDTDEEQTDAATALTAAVSNLAETIRETGAEITHGELPVLRIRETELQRLLQNLIGNGIKYRRAEEPPRIHIWAEREGDLWRLAVRDNGIGIAPEYRETVFGMFKRLHGDGKYPGTGIGLAICHKIAERHGGRIWVESETGRGSTFFFTLPGVEER